MIECRVIFSRRIFQRASCISTLYYVTSKCEIERDRNGRTGRISQNRINLENWRKIFASRRKLAQDNLVLYSSSINEEYFIPSSASIDKTLTLFPSRNSISINIGSISYIYMPQVYTYSRYTLCISLHVPSLPQRKNNRELRREFIHRSHSRMSLITL